MTEQIYGYGFDFHVFIVGGSVDAAEELAGMTDFALEYWGTRLSGYRGDICDCDGALINVTTAAHECGGVLFIKETDYLEDDERAICIDGDYHAAIEKLLRDAIIKSPVGKLYVNIRCQGMERNNIRGTKSVSAFMQDVKTQRIRGNCTYILCDAEDEDLNVLVNRFLAEATANKS